MKTATHTTMATSPDSELIQELIAESKKAHAAIFQFEMTCIRAGHGQAVFPGAMSAYRGVMSMRDALESLNAS